MKRKDVSNFVRQRDNKAIKKVSFRSITPFQKRFLENIKKSDKILKFLPKNLTLRKVQSKLLASIFKTGKEKT
jgi:hypothetical protein